MWNAKFISTCTKEIDFSSHMMCSAIKKKQEKVERVDWLAEVPMNLGPRMEWFWNDFLLIITHKIFKLYSSFGLHACEHQSTINHALVKEC